MLFDFSSFDESPIAVKNIIPEIINIIKAKGGTIFKTTKSKTLPNISNMWQGPHSNPLQGTRGSVLLAKIKNGIAKNNADNKVQTFKDILFIFFF